MIRVDGALREVDWNVALDYVAHALKDVVGNSGAEALAALASPQATLEELYLLQKLTRGLGSGNVDFRPRRRDFSADGKLGGIPWLGLKLSEIKDLDAALVVGSFPAQGPSAVRAASAPAGQEMGQGQPALGPVATIR
jgi:NADH-quinone oxidoreductase subunit G